MFPIQGAIAEGPPAMPKRLKTPPHRDFKFIRGHRGHDVIRIKLPSGGVGFVATMIPQEVLAAFAKSLSRKIAKSRRLARASVGETGDLFGYAEAEAYRGPSMTDIVARLEIRGRVQGVGYRWSIAQEAGRCGVRGWVRNRHDGSAEALLAGNQEQVDRLIAWARRGPDSALVESIDVFEGEGSFASFEQLPTG
jgi:acylphosphatase